MRRCKANPNFMGWKLAALFHFVIAVIQGMGFAPTIRDYAKSRPFLKVIAFGRFSQTDCRDMHTMSSEWLVAAFLQRRYY
jgi:hypothetical protein